MTRAIEGDAPCSSPPPLLLCSVLGGTFALYSLISRYAKVRLIPNQQAEDAMVSNYSIEAPSSQLRRAQWFKQKLESSRAAKMVLFTLTIKD